MPIMPDVHLRNVDLNLLHALHALLEERHVTRAAKRSFLSQPAMGRALDRLRETFGDPLLVRTGRVYERTVRGESVLRELESIMGRLGAMVRGEEFSPARTQQGFRVAMTDNGVAILLPKRTDFQSGFCVSCRLRPADSYSSSYTQKISATTARFGRNPGWSTNHGRSPSGAAWRQATRRASSSVLSARDLRCR